MISSESDIQYASIRIRFVAMVIDQVILYALGMVVSYLLLYSIYLFIRTGASFGETFKGGFIQWVSMGVEFCISIPYYIGLHYRLGATVGKKLVGVHLVDFKTKGRVSLKQSVGRFFASLLSQILFFYGIFYCPL
jgi:uncharacterized RDD family membrane protein YckC